MEKINQTFEHWISQYPETGHPLDQERYYKFIDEVVAYDDYLGPSWLRNKLNSINHSMTDEQAERLISQFDNIVEYGKRLAHNHN